MVEIKHNDRREHVEISRAPIDRIFEIRAWFEKEYSFRLHHIQRCKYLGIKPEYDLYELEKEAYDKEQELRALQGMEPLDDIKIHNIF